MIDMLSCEDAGGEEARVTSLHQGEADRFSGSSRPEKEGSASRIAFWQIPRSWLREREWRPRMMR
jgi:hypothetical protein